MSNHVKSLFDRTSRLDSFNFKEKVKIYAWKTFELHTKRYNQLRHLTRLVTHLQSCEI